MCPSIGFVILFIVWKEHTERKTKHKSTKAKELKRQVGHSAHSTTPPMQKPQLLVVAPDQSIWSFSATYFSE